MEEKVEKRLAEIEEEISQLNRKIVDLKEEERRLSVTYEDYTGKYIKFEDFGCRYIYMYVKEQIYENGKCFIVGPAMIYSITAKTSSYSLMGEYMTELVYIHQEIKEIEKSEFQDKFEKISKNFTESFRRKIKTNSN